MVLSVVGPLPSTAIGHTPYLPRAKGTARCLEENLCVASSFSHLSDDFVCHLPCLAMILAGKAYYDGVAKIGEIATGSPVSTELGELILIICKPSSAASSDKNV